VQFHSRFLDFFLYLISDAAATVGLDVPANHVDFGTPPPPFLGKVVIPEGLAFERLS
jgi:hypothetical protein